jgi:endonuclease YncB( thermonuclease family)
MPLKNCRKLIYDGMRGVLITLVALLLASAALGQEAVVSARIVAITDGDTVKALLADNELLKVRLSWIDAPEKNQAFGQRSKQHLSELVFGCEVELHTHGLDRYGRTLAVILLDGVDINLEQVKSGFAWAYTRYLDQASSEIQASYRQAESEAREQKRGLWSDPWPVEPWLYRRAMRDRPSSDASQPLNLLGVLFQRLGMTQPRNTLC